NDVRYTMPVVVYVALLGTAWFATSGRPWLRRGAGALLVLVAVVNLVQTSWGAGPAARVTLPGDWAPTPSGAGYVTLLSSGGWLVAGPEKGGDVLGSLEAAREQGARLVAIDRVGPSTSEFNLPGLGILTRLAGLEVAPDDDYGAL